MRLARVAADHTVEPARRRMEAPDVAAEDHVGAAHDAEALGLEGVAEHVEAGEDAQDQRRGLGELAGGGHSRKSIRFAATRRRAGDTTRASASSFPIGSEKPPERGFVYPSCCPSSSRPMLSGYSSSSAPRIFAC